MHTNIERDGDDDDKKIPKKALQSSLVTPSSGQYVYIYDS